MRRQFTLGQTPSLNNSFQESLTFQAVVMKVFNNTSNPVFFNFNKRLPGTTLGSYDWAVPPRVGGVSGAGVFPVDAKEFSGFLPLAPGLSDATQIVTVVFEDGA